MDDERPPQPKLPEPEDDDLQSVDPAVVPLPTLPPEISSADEELRRRIEAGAKTPEELRALAAMIRQHREREDVVWREEMRPALKKAKKAPFRFADLVERPEEPRVTNGLFYALVVAGVAMVLVLAATRSSIIWVLIPLVAVLGYAFVVGRRGDPVDAPAPDAPPRTDEDASG
jgi:hypothetical protein